MGKINNVFSASLQAVNNGNRLDGKDKEVTLKFEPKEIGAVQQGKKREYPPTMTITENDVETALLKHFGFKANDPADIARVKQLLQTEGSPFAKLNTTSETGKFTAYYNNRTGKYEVVDNVEKNLYRQLQGKAAEVKTQIGKEKQNVVSNQANPNDVIAGKNGITNNKRTELENKLKNQASISAPNQNESEKTVKSITGAIESVTGTSNPFAAPEIGKQFNRLGVSSLHLTGKALELSNYFSEKMNDALRYVAPDSVDELLNQSDKMNRENAEALQNASSAVTNEDKYIDTKAKQLGQEIPLTEDLANKIMYFPEAIPNTIDSAIKGEFKEDDGSYSDKVGKIIGGLNPIGDVRDIVANTKNVIDGKKGSGVALGASIIGAIPGGGDVAKPIIKEVGEELTEKAIKEGGGEAIEKLAKEEAEQLAKVEAEQIAKRYDEISKSGHPVQRHGEHITEQQLDDRAMYGKDPVTGTTDDAFRKNPDGTPKPHNYSKDATKFTSKENLVKAEEFVKNSQKYKDEFVIAERNGLEEIVVENIKLEDIFGTNYKDAVFGKTRIGTKNNPIGTTQTDFTDGTVKAVFKKDSIGQWSLESMFAKPKQ